MFVLAGLSSPPASLYDRYSSPTANPTRRRLFADSDGAPEAGPAGRAPPQPVVSTVPVQSPEAVSVTPVPGQTLVTVATATVTANNGQTVTIPVQGEGRAAAQPFRVAEHSQGELHEYENLTSTSLSSWLMVKFPKYFDKTISCITR